MSTAIVLNPGNIRVLSVRALIPYRGVPLFDCELDPNVPIVPSGKVTLTIGQTTVSGTVDPRGSGQFVEFVHVRILAGGAGWDKPVGRQDFQSDGGVSSRDVIQATATEVGETANVPSVYLYPSHFERSAGPASRVLAAFSWWVDLSGVTQVGPRPVPTPPAPLELLRWDPTTQVAELGGDEILIPGTAISDPRIPSSPVIVRDVEQRFDGTGSSVVAYCGAAAVSQLMGDFRALVEEFSGRKFLKTYLYRIAGQNSDGRLQLQAVDSADGVPDAMPVEPWSGVSGASVKYKLGTLVRVSFFDGDPSQPIADSYQPGQVPLEATLDGVLVHLGPSATRVDLAGGAQAVALAPPLTTFLGQLQTWAAAVAGALSSAGFPIVAPQAALVAAIAAASSNTPATKVTAQ